MLPLAMLQARLRNVYWIGGGSGAGKSTIARRLASEYGLSVYATDDVMHDHARRSTPEGAPQLARFLGMDEDERWVNDSPATMLDDFHWYRGEAFGLIVEDLLRLSVESGVIAEGFRLLPHLVEPLLGAPPRAVWLLPTPRFRWTAFESRGTAWDIPGRTSDPERAQRNLLERDRMFTDRLSEETKRLGLPAIEVDTTLGEDELAVRVARVFMLAGGGAQPGGGTGAGRGEPGS
jgi:2-phosphoglycerate kinase